LNEYLIEVIVKKILNLHMVYIFMRFIYMSSTSITRNELIEIIKSNNMVEEFVNWLRNSKKIDIDPISLKDVDYDLLLEFVQSKGLLKTETLTEFENVSRDDDNILDNYIKNIESTKPKKIRRKT